MLRHLSLQVAITIRGKSQVKLTMTNPKQCMIAFSITLFSLVPLSRSQTAACANWSFFSLPAPATGTYPSGINRWNVVTGVASYASSPFSKAFTRYSDGSVKTYLFPSSVWTEFSRRNSQGVTVGSYGDSSYNNLIHGFVLTNSGTATVNYPGALHTRLSGINYWGSIVGNYVDSMGKDNGFELKNSNFTSIHYPGSGMTQAESISDTGVIVGFYENTLSNGALGDPHGFVLANGVYKTLDNPKGALHYAHGTKLFDINASGVIVGSYHLNGNNYSFLYRGGTFKDIKVPNAGTSVATGINGNGYVTGDGFINGKNAGYIASCQ